MVCVVCSLFTTRTIISWVYGYAKRANFVFNFVCQVSKLSEKERKKKTTTHTRTQNIIQKPYTICPFVFHWETIHWAKNCFHFGYLCNSGYISCRLTSKFVGVANFSQSVDVCIQKQATLLAKYVRFSFVNFDSHTFFRTKQTTCIIYVCIALE